MSTCVGLSWAGCNSSQVSNLPDAFGHVPQPTRCRSWLTKTYPAEQIKSIPSPSTHVFHLLAVPRMTTLCTNLLSDLGVLGSIEVREFQLGLIPLDKDLLSLEIDDAWRRLALVSPNVRLCRVGG